eukprot:CAMPEP_0173129930 /NCGR_PEP_ID=MMETSP1102-20130122/59606_1 /TAXON_ID=49646 /ORGANISM="Geminigera sp., Strain Caron Lab Isolate" /LENGTH=94 /DNA_ID=CAMNT_0014040685 /DNA_START=279 /DNA_END=561 /DNA_ORIENTATION=-
MGHPPSCNSGHTAKTPFGGAAAHSTTPLRARDDSGSWIDGSWIEVMSGGAELTEALRLDTIGLPAPAASAFIGSMCTSESCSASECVGEIVLPT